MWTCTKMLEKNPNLNDSKKNKGSKKNSLDLVCKYCILYFLKDSNK